MPSYQLAANSESSLTEVIYVHWLQIAKLATQSTQFQKCNSSSMSEQINVVLDSNASESPEYAMLV